MFDVHKELTPYSVEIVSVLARLLTLSLLKMNLTKLRKLLNPELFNKT